MKLYFNSMARPKRGAKDLAAQLPHIQLAKAQEVIAYLSGYESWLALKATCEDPATIPSLDDTELTQDELASRQSVLLVRVKEIFNVSREQGLRILDLVSLTKPASVKPQAEPHTPIVGTNVYMPDYGLVFGPDYPFLFCLLPDVRLLEIDLIQPDDEPTLTQLASQMRVVFKSGKSLEIEGIYLWKFLDLVPPALQGADKELRSDNPYTRLESPKLLLARIRRAYQLLWKRAEGAEFNALLEPPQSISINFEQGVVTKKEAPGLLAPTHQELMEYIRPYMLNLATKLQPKVDELMRAYLQHGYMEFGYRKVNAESISPAYTPASWAGKEAVPFKEFLSMFSPTPVSESGCGGNLRFREKLMRDLEVHIPSDMGLGAILAKLKKDRTALFSAICSDLGFSNRTAGLRIADALLTTKEAIQLRAALFHGIFKAQEDKVLSTWGVELSTRKPRPLTRQPVFVPKSEGAQHG